MKILFVLIVWLAIPYFVQAAESFDITIHWTCQDAGCLVEQKDFAALALNYQDEIEDIENPGQYIPNPVSKKQTIINKLVETLQAFVESGMVITADQYRIDAITTAKTATVGITGE